MKAFLSKNASVIIIGSIIIITGFVISEEINNNMHALGLELRTMSVHLY